MIHTKYNALLYTTPYTTQPQTEPNTPHDTHTHQCKPQANHTIHTPTNQATPYTTQQANHTDHTPTKPMCNKPINKTNQNKKY